MRKFEIILAIIVLIAIGLKLLVLSFASFILLLSTLVLAFFYLIMTLYLLTEKKRANRQHKVKRLGGVLLGFVFFSSICGGLFKLMIWPGSYSLLLLGITGTTVFSLIAVSYYLVKGGSYYEQGLIRCFIIGGFSVIMLFTSKLDLVEIYHRDNPELARLIKKSMKHPEDKELMKKVQKKINEVEEE